MREVKFIKDFATKKKGDVVPYDGPLASRLVRNLKVAKFTDEKTDKPTAKSDDKKKEKTK